MNLWLRVGQTVRMDVLRQGTVVGALALAACGGSTVTEGVDGGRGTGSSSHGASSSVVSSSQGSGTNSSVASSSQGSGTNSSVASSSGSGTNSSVASSSGSGTNSSVASSSSQSSTSQEVPTNHRPNDDQCTAPASPGDCSIGGVGGGGGGPGNCSMDSQCTMGTNGRCIESNGGALYCACSYDTCADDAACGSGQTCACHGSPYSEGGNTCVPGNCRVDSDCGANGYCSPSESTTGCGGGVAGYYCHTPNDKCVNDSQCTGSFGIACVYSTTQMFWQCQSIPECA